MVCDREGGQDCLFRGKTVFVDANFIISIADVLGKSLDLNNRDWRNKLTDFKTEFASFLQKCCTCPPSNQISTSESILTNEMNPEIADSAIRRKSDFFGKVAYKSGSSRFFSEIYSILRSNIRPISVNHNMVNALRVTLPHYSLSDNDLSLGVSALTESNSSSSVLVVTSDEDLREALTDLVSMGNITLRTVPLMTNNMTVIDSYYYSTHLHECCMLSNNTQLSILGFLVVNDFTRPMNDRKRRIKGRQIEDTFGLLQKAIEIKNRRTIN